MASANDFITRAMQMLGLVEPGEAPSGEDTETGLAVLNEWIDTLGTQRLSIFKVTRNTPYTLAAGTASYTVGSGGTINIARPVWIEHCGLIIDTTAATPTEVGRRVFTDDEWAGIAQKTLQSNLITGIWYDHDWSAGLARIWPWPIPNVATTQVVLYTPTALTEFADLTTDYTFPPGYKRAIRANLAMELAAEYAGAVVTPRLEKMADLGLTLIKRANLRLSTVDIDPSVLTRRGRTLSASRFASGAF